MAKFLHHIFVCENQRPPENPKGCCAAKGAAQVREAMKAEIEKRGWRKIVRASSAGCLDQCSCGVAVVIYPQDTWYGRVTPADVPEIFDALKEGRVVERLRIPDENLTGRLGNLP